MGKKAVLLLLVVSFLFSMYSYPYAAEVIKHKFAN